MDRLPSGEGRIMAERLGGVAVSALKRQGLGDLLEAVEDRLWESEGPGRRLRGLAREA